MIWKRSRGIDGVYRGIIGLGGLLIGEEMGRREKEGRVGYMVGL